MPISQKAHFATVSKLKRAAGSAQKLTLIVAGVPTQ